MTLRFVATLLVEALSLLFVLTVISAAPPADIRPGAVLVKFRADLALSSVRALLPQGATFETTIGPNSYALRVPIGTEQHYIEQLAGLPEILYAQGDHRAAAQLQPSDPSFGQQWNLAQIRMPQAWEVVTDTSSLIVAVLDTGITVAHPDLEQQLWVNQGEIAGNESDDDNNGVIDDRHGAHFYHVYSGGQASPREDGDINDPHGHGTHVAGVIAARGNNGVGVAGIAWRARVMMVRVLESDAYGWESDIIRGLHYAIDNGAKVVNLSLGVAQPTSALADAVAQAEAHGVLLVAAAGNTNGSILYPAAYPTVLSIGASDRYNQRAIFSSYGAGLDLLAPGVDILSTWNGVPYFTRSGTSMAAPHVTGVVALIIVQNPTTTPQQMRSCLLRAATDLGPPGWDDTTGAGILDAARAVQGCPFEIILPLIAR